MQANIYGMESGEFKDVQVCGRTNLGRLCCRQRRHRHCHRRLTKSTQQIMIITHFYARYSLFMRIANG